MRNKITAFVLSLIIGISIVSNVYANTQEIATTTPYYSHPVSGVIEDPGNNPGIGQGMTENVVSPQALVETTDDGRIFLTVRYNLANYIKNETFAVQNYGDQDFYSVSAEITGQTEETRDYRFEIPSKNVVVRTSLYVAPMGRDVIFYFKISDFVEGNTDFATLENVNSSSAGGTNEKVEANQETQINNVPPKEASANQSTMPNLKGLKPVENNSQVGQVLGPQTEGEKIEQHVVNSKLSAGDLGYSHGLLTKDSEIIKKLFYSEDIEEETKQITKPGKITMACIYGLVGLLVIMTSALLIMAILSFIYKAKVEEELNQKRSENYEE
ncbi:MAG: heme-binding Shp domain-containing protein [Peptoniphilus duerdenii]|uniref:heme-binding Shp domain-containing protein n=1 Tax=Peptoniphilus duerdenii TaxID=507750 RepID=UPI00255185FE|nr:heme-binding Shp domain-containing protein [Peptoniphilus duerdenii]MDK8276734.1 heme-binding Shp domain-containing protein [Peptoniphilus duerdenii]